MDKKKTERMNKNMEQNKSPARAQGIFFILLADF